MDLPVLHIWTHDSISVGEDGPAGHGGVVLGMRTFGMSASMKIVAEHFGFTAEHVIAAARETPARSRQR